MHTVEPTWPMVRRPLVSIASMVNANTKPADVTTPPVRPSARMRPVCNPASEPTATRMMNVGGNTNQCRCRPIRCCQTSMDNPNAPAQEKATVPGMTKAATRLRVNESERGVV